MDPDEALDYCREICAKFDMVNLSLERQAELARDLREHFEALDGWMSNGGFKPQEWSDHVHRT